ncbi:MAG: YjjG family noncanonical pyrimidine nucleotidase [Oscillospiraceae bacterium]|nr:YjjG family noncanonical pyrimidine nucleotidase [Oscillospiraceae bacterium]
MVKYLFLDMDDTILDFHQAEAVAIRKTLAQFGVEPTDAVCRRYSQINDWHWKALERKEITREQVLTGRFEVLFGELGIAIDSQQCASRYTQNLAKGDFVLPGAVEVLEKLQGKYQLYLASNGTTWVQKERIAGSGIGKYFDRIFISQEMGANKPALEFFDACFREIPGFAKENALIVGDSLTSDILGGNNAGILTCWYNPKGKPRNPEIVPDYEITALADLLPLLETL